MTAYPNAPLSVRIRIALGADLAANPSTYTWTDISSRINWSDTISHQVGAADDESETNSQLSLSLVNDDGALTSDNPESPYYPYFTTGCPIEYSVDPGDGGGWRVRGISYLASAVEEWPARTQYRCLSKIVAAGMFRRLGRKPLPASPLRRTVPSAAKRRAYWSMEDASGATSAASHTPLTAQPLLSATVPFDFGQQSPVAGAASVAKISTGQQMYGVFNPTTGTSIRASMLLRVDTVPAVDTVLMDLFYRGGTAYLHRLCIGPGTMRFRAYDPTGVDISGAVAYGFGAQQAGMIWLDWTVAQVGSTVTWEIYQTTWTINSAGAPTPVAGLASGSFAGTLGSAYFMTLAPNLDVNNVLIGSVVITEPPLAPQGGYAAVVGWTGNRASDRVNGMCNEFSVPSSATSGKGEVMGPQLLDSLLANLRDVAATDHGVLTDHLGVVGYTSLAELYNTASTLSVSRSVRGELALPLDPVTDDQDKANIVSAERRNGSTYTLRDDADVALSGVYERAPYTVNVALDSQLPGHAGWLLAHGTAGKRYAAWTLDLLRAPQLVTPWLATPLGGRITATSLPPQSAKGSVVRQIRGWTETLGPGRMNWKVVLNAVPIDPYEAFTFDTDRFETSGTELAQAGTSTDTVLLAATAGAPMITTVSFPTHFPVDLDVAGERVTLTANVAEPVTDAFTRTTSSGWGSVPATAHRPAEVYSYSSINGAITDLSTNGSGAVQAVPGAPAALICMLFAPATGGLVNPDLTATVVVPSVPTGTGSYDINLVYRRVGTTQYLLRLDIATTGVCTLQLYTPAGNKIVEKVMSFTHTGSTQYGFRAAPIGTLHRLKIWKVASGEPTAWDATIIDSERTARGMVGVRAGCATGNTNAKPVNFVWDDLTVGNVSAMTVTRSIDGVVKTQAQGNPVKLWRGRGRGI